MKAELLPVRIRGAVYRYPGASARALDGVDLEIEAGEYVLLAGASGSGKSTLCRLLNGLVPHLYGGRLEGSITVSGLDPRASTPADFAGLVGLVLQNPDAGLFASSVERELALGPENLGLDPRTIARRVSRAAGELGIEDLLARAPGELSGGERQLVAIAAQAAMEPPLIVLDEPFAHLDAEASERVRRWLRGRHAAGATIIVAEHRLRDLASDADRLVVMAGGRIAAQGTPREVLAGELPGLCAPLPVRLMRALGRPETPLTAGEAVGALASLAPRTREAARSLLRSLRAPSAPSDPLRPAVVELQALRFAYDGRRVLQDAGLRVAAGECVALVGPNGSGKTTLLKHLDGLLRPSSGTVRALGRAGRELRPERMAREIGFVFQNPNDQLFAATVREELEAGPRALRVLDTRRLQELARRLDLEALLARPPIRLSEGEKKRVAFATALAVGPRLLVLDEPTSGQDRQGREALAAIIRRSCEEGASVVLATHDVDFALEHCPRWIVMAEGRSLADGSAESLVADRALMERARLRPSEILELLCALEALDAGR